MPELSDLPAQDNALESFLDDVREAGHREEIPNEARGCGHLDHNAAYVRSDVHALSFEGGEIPTFVELEAPVEHREHSGRGAIIPGWERFPGLEFSLAYANEGYDTIPEGDIHDHLDRCDERLGFGGGEHYGEIVAARAFDIIMSVGETNWHTADNFIEECRRMGLNLKIPTGPNQPPPVVNPMRTRCWVVHPNGAGVDRAGIIGYAYLTRTIYTTGSDATADDPDVPTYAEEWAETGKVHLATPGEELSEEEANTASLEEF